MEMSIPYCQIPSRTYHYRLNLIIDNLFFQQPDQSDIQVPPKEKKFKGYFKIARHYGWALNYTFYTLGFQTVIIVEGLYLHRRFLIIWL